MIWPLSSYNETVRILRSYVSCILMSVLHHEFIDGLIFLDKSGMHSCWWWMQYCVYLLSWQRGSHGMLRRMFVTGKERWFRSDLRTTSSTSRVWHVLLVSTRTFCVRRLELYPSLVLCNHRISNWDYWLHRYLARCLTSIETTWFIIRPWILTVPLMLVSHVSNLLGVKIVLRIHSSRLMKLQYVSLFYFDRLRDGSFCRCSGACIHSTFCIIKTILHFLV